MDVPPPGPPPGDPLLPQPPPEPDGMSSTAKMAIAVLAATVIGLGVALALISGGLR